MYGKEIERTSDKKQAQIDAFEKEEFRAGQDVLIPENLLHTYADKDKSTMVEIIKVNEKSLRVLGDTNSRTPKQVTIKKTDVISKNIRKVGANPFDERFQTVRPVAFSLESILFTLNVLGEKRDEDDMYKMNGVKVQYLNWNPYVYNYNDEKEIYQRDFVWTLEDNQNLIDSIYNQIDCGKILVRKISWSELEKRAKAGETELAFNEIVDGKQRLNAIRGFMKGEYTDSKGNYFADLSASSQHIFTNHQLLSFAEMSENTTDEEVIYQFLKLNFCGVPQSKEHIEYVMKIQGKLGTNH